MSDTRRMLNIMDYFNTHAPKDIAGRPATAGWMDLMSAENNLEEGTDLRNAFLSNEELDKSNPRTGVTFKVFPRTDFDKSNVVTLAEKIANFMCDAHHKEQLRKQGRKGVFNVLQLSLLEIMKNCVDHSAAPGEGSGSVSSARTDYAVTVFVRDTGCGFTEKYKEVLNAADPQHCPQERHDAIAIDLAIKQRCTTARGAVTDNRGNGLPNFLAAADLAVIATGRGRYLHLNQEAEGRNDLRNEGVEPNSSLIHDRFCQGVAIDGYFDLIKIGSRLSRIKEPSPDDIDRQLLDLLRRREAVDMIQRR